MDTSAKILWWERNGFWLAYKRLEKGKLKFPQPQEDAMKLTYDQFQWLLSGLNYESHSLPPEITASNFY